MKIGKATRDSIYPELGPSAEAQMENVYETIKKVPEISIDISAQGKISKYSSYTWNKLKHLATFTNLTIILEAFNEIDSDAWQNTKSKHIILMLYFIYS